MVTRFYGVATTAAPVTPNFDAGWQSTTGAVRRSLATAKAASTETQATVAVTSGAGNETLAFQLISEPLEAGSIAGTVTIVTRGRELAGTDNIGARVRCVKVISNDGSTVRGTLLALGNHSVTTELGTSLAGRLAANATSLSSVTAEAGDRILVEIGYGMTTTGTSPQYDMVIGGNGTDHTTTEGDTTGTVPWIEFSQTLAFQVTLAPANATQAQTAENVVLEFDPIGMLGDRLWLNERSASDGSSTTSWTDSSGAGNTLVNASGTITHETNEINGRAIERFDAGTDDFLLKSSAVGLGSSWTLAFVHKPTNVTGPCSVLNFGNINANGPLVTINGGRLQVWQSNGLMAAESASTLSNSTVYRHVITCDSSGNVLIYTDGSLDTQNATARTFAYTTPAIVVGAFSSSVEEKYVGDFAELLLYNAVATSGQRADLFSYFNTRWVGGPTLVIAAATQAQSAENLALTQVHALAVAAAMQAQSAQNLALTQVHVLVVQGATQAQTVQNVVILIVLGIQDAGQAQTAQNIVLTQLHQLVIQGAGQAQTAQNIALIVVLKINAANQAQIAGNVTLTQLHLLVIQSANQAQSTGPLTLGAATLAIQTATQAQTAQSLVLSQVHNLVVAAALQAASAGNVGLVQTPTLHPANSQQAQLATILSLSQVHALTVAGTIHAHTAAQVVLALGALPLVRRGSGGEVLFRVVETDQARQPAGGQGGQGGSGGGGLRQGTGAVLTKG